MLSYLKPRRSNTEVYKNVRPVYRCDQPLPREDGDPQESIEHRRCREMAPLIFLAAVGFLMTLPAAEPHVLPGQEELVKLEKRGAPQQPPWIGKPAEQRKEHEREPDKSKVHPPPVKGPHIVPKPNGEVVILPPQKPRGRQQPQHSAKPAQQPGAGNSVAHPQQPTHPRQLAGAGSSNSHPPAAAGQQPSGSGKNAGSQGCSCHEKSCPSHPCRRGESSVRVKQVVKTGHQAKPKSPPKGSNSCPCWDRSCPSHPCEKAYAG